MQWLLQLPRFCFFIFNWLVCGHCCSVWLPVLFVRPTTPLTSLLLFTMSNDALNPDATWMIYSLEFGLVECIHLLTFLWQHCHLDLKCVPVVEMGSRQTMGLFVHNEFCLKQVKPWPWLWVLRYMGADQGVAGGNLFTATPAAKPGWLKQHSSDGYEEPGQIYCRVISGLEAAWVHEQVRWNVIRESREAHFGATLLPHTHTPCRKYSF